MRIEKQIKNHLVFSGDALIDALRKINDNQSRIVFVVEDNGVLIGALSDGDVVALEGGRGGGPAEPMRVG
jgi:N-acetylneuraminate synthase